MPSDRQTSSAWFTWNVSPCLRASFLLLAMLCPGIHWLMGLADIVLGRPAAHFYRFERLPPIFFGRSSLAADS